MPLVEAISPAAKVEVLKTVFRMQDKADNVIFFASSASGLSHPVTYTENVACVS